MSEPGKTVTFTFPLAAGLHARPASMLQDEASRFASTIRFTNHANGTVADAKSTLGLISTVTRSGDPCSIHIEGEDEHEAYAAMQRFVEDILPHADDALTVPSVAPTQIKAPPRMLGGIPHLTGTGVSPGFARAKARLLGPSDPFALIPADAPAACDEEQARVSRAIDHVAREIEQALQARPAGPRAAILKAHLSIVRDQEFARKVREYLAGSSCSAGRAIAESAKRFEEVLQQSGNTYLQERAADIRDIAGRLVSFIYGTKETQSVLELTEDTICVAESMAPSEYLGLNKRFLKGLVLAHGETTSHTVILARAEGIPCVSGVRDAHRLIPDGEVLVVDADRGLVFAHPDIQVERFYGIETRLQLRTRGAMERFTSLPGRTADGKRLEIAANASSLDEVESALRNGAEGVGLFRTEMLYVNRRDMPGEEEQAAVYTSMVRAAKGVPIIFRTLDVGGDKPLQALPLPAEENPFLGYRAVRMYDDFPAIIDAQLRAMLRASAQGPVKIMFPMITSVSEVRALKARLDTCKAALQGEGVACGTSVPVGIMVEVPSVIFQIDQLCPLVDFFSIGSNDLTQYLLAVDRGNEKVARLYDPFHPAVLRSIRQIIDEAHRRDRWVGVCGEMASLEPALPLFVGFGIDEISVASGRIPLLKAILSRLASDECKRVAGEALAMEAPGESRRKLESFVRSSLQTSLLDENLVELHAPDRTKAEIIHELVGLLKVGERVDDADRVEEAVWQREETFPTDMGYGIAIPHCKSPHVLSPAIAALKTAEPVPWKQEGDPISLAILIAIPENSHGDMHLKIIARLARKLMHEEFRQGLMDAADPRAFTDLLRREVGA